MQNYPGRKIRFFHRRIYVWIMLIFGISLFVILLKQVSINELVAVLSRADARYLFAALVAGFTATIFRTVRYAAFFPVPGRWLDLYGAFSLMRLLNFALPFRSGEVIFLKMLKKYRFSPSIAETAPAWLLMRVTDVAALTLWFTFALSVASFNVFESARWVLVGISAGLIVIILGLPIWASRTRYNLSDSWVAQRLYAFQAGIGRIRGIPVFLRTLALAVLIWAAMLTLGSFAQLAFSTPLNIYECSLVSALVLVLSMLPIHAPLAIGTGEAAWVGVMAMMGVDVPLAIGLAISIRLVLVSIIFIDGLIGLCLLWAGKYL